MDIHTAEPAAALETAQLLRLLHLASPALPIGAFAYSQGLEQAVALGWVSDEPSAQRWIFSVAKTGLLYLDVPVLSRIMAAFRAEDADAVARWTEFVRAARSSQELQDEDRRLGVGLAKILAATGVAAATAFAQNPSAHHLDTLPPTYLTVLALAAHHYGLPTASTATALVFSWLENQIAAAIRLVPLGQTAGQRILAAGIAQIPQWIEKGLALDDDALAFSAPAHAIASAQHEILYSRIFRS